MISDIFFSMPVSSRCLLFSALLTLTNALPWAGPQPTPSYVPVDINPRPTAAPRVQRDTMYPPNYCGWVNGLSNSPLLCPTDETCVWDTSNIVVVCCPSSGCSAMVTGCVDSNSPIQTAFNPSVLTCGTGSHCYQNMFPGGYSQWNCGSTNWASIIQTMFVGQASDAKLILSFTTFNPTLTLPATATTAPISSASGTVSGSSTSSQSLGSTSASSATTGSTTSTSSSISTSTTPSTLSTITTSSPTSTSSQTSALTSSTIPSTTTSTSIVASGSSSSAQNDGNIFAPVTSDGRRTTGVIVGSVFGALGGLAFIGAFAFWLVRRQRNRISQSRFDARTKEYYGDYRGSSSFTTTDRNARVGEMAMSDETTLISQHDSQEHETNSEVESYHSENPHQPANQQRSYPFSPDHIVSPASSTHQAIDTAYALQSAISWPLEAGIIYDPTAVPAPLKHIPATTTPPIPSIPPRSHHRLKRDKSVRGLLWDTRIAKGQNQNKLPTRELSSSSSTYSQESGTGRTALAREMRRKEMAKMLFDVGMFKMIGHGGGAGAGARRMEIGPEADAPGAEVGLGLGIGVPKPSRVVLRDIDGLAKIQVKVPSPLVEEYRPMTGGRDSVPIVKVPRPMSKEERARCGGRTYTPVC